MLFQHVAIAGLAHIDAPRRLSSDEINTRLKPTLDRLKIKVDVLQDIAGIHARRLWDGEMQASDAATLAGVKALADAGVDPSRVGLLVNTSVSRDFLEPSTASIVSGNLGLPDTCQNFDVANACLAFLNGMELVGAMIERGSVDYGLVVHGEGSREVVEATIARLRQPSCDAQTFRDNFATLTLGSGAAAAVLTRTDLAPRGHRFLGGVSLAATEHRHLCVGQPVEMRTDATALLNAGIALAGRTFGLAGELMGWQSARDLDHLVLHQVSAVHTDKLLEQLGADPSQVFSIFPRFGNVGPASIPIALAKARDAGRLSPGQRLGLLGIGTFGFGLIFMVLEIFIEVLQAYVFAILASIYIQLSVVDEH